MIQSRRIFDKEFFCMNFSIRDLKGIGPRKEALFARLHLATVSD